MHERLAPSMKRRLIAVLVGGLAFAGLGVATTPSPAAATLPSQCTVNGASVQCVYLKTGGNQTLDLPDGVASVSLRVVGQAGSSSSFSGGVGGRAAVVTGTVAVGGDQDLLVQFLDDGGAATSAGGAGGDSTRVQLTRPRFSPLTVAWAAGGGGGGAGGEKCVHVDIVGQCDSWQAVPGGGGGNAGSAGQDGASTVTDTSTDVLGAEGGEAGTTTAGGSGGAGSPSGAAGAAGAGGAGGTGNPNAIHPGGGGGGGGGAYGGGGGGSSHRLDPWVTGAGGGGGGSSLAPAGGSTATATFAETARVIVTFTLPPTASVTPTTWTFPNTNVGAQSAGKLFTLENTSASPLAVSSLTLTGPDADQFQKGATGCGATLAPGAFCSVLVAFKPASAGSKSATLVFDTNAANGPHEVSLSGVGAQPAASLSTTTLAFADTVVDTVSPTKSVTLTNTGTGPLTVNNTSLFGLQASNFLKSVDTCTAGLVLAPSEGCAVVLQLRPTSRGLKSATMRFNTNAPGSPHDVTVSGTGIAPVAGVDPASIAFGAVGVPLASAPEDVVVTNTGDAPMTVGNVSLAGPNPGQFDLLDDSCSAATLAPNASCDVTVQYSPDAVGSHSAELRIPSNATGSPHLVALTGTGAGATVTLSPTSHAFGPSGVGGPAKVRTQTVTNSGAGLLTVDDVTVSGVHAADFDVEADDCVRGGEIAPGRSCEIVIRFDAGAVGARTAQMVIETNAGNSPHQVALSGTGVGPTVVLSPTAQTFGNAAVGGAGVTRTQTVTNSGLGTLYVDDVSLTGAHAADYSIGDASDCLTRELGPDESCEVSIVFNARGVGSRTAQLVIESNAAASPHQVALSGVGVPTAQLQIRGPGSLYAEGHGNRQTLTIGTGATARAKFFLKVFNTSSSAQTYRVSADSLGAPANVKLTLGSNSAELVKDASGRWITPSIPAGGNKVLAFWVDPTTGGQVTAKHTLRLRTADGAEHDHATFETNVQAPVKGTDGYGLYAKGSGQFVGGDVNGQTTSQVPAKTGQTKSYAIKLRNDSTSAHPVLVKMAATANACWTITVKKGTLDVTEALTSGGYTTPAIKAGGFLNLAVRVKRVAAGCGAGTWEFSTWSGGTKRHHSSILANAVAGTE